MEGINRDSWCWLYATEAINCSNDAKSCRKHFITLYLLFQNFSGFCTVAGFGLNSTDTLPQNGKGPSQHRGT